MKGMKDMKSWISLAAAFLCVIPLGSQSPSPQAVREPLTVMSFNIRYGTANDGDNHWKNRRQMLFDLLKEHDADLIGVQEALDAQLREIAKEVPVYGVVGVGRDDGATRGEYAAILFRRDRFHVSDSGTFWFSDTPEVIASRSWGNTITRICTWARFVDRNGRAFWHYNVHLDHQSQPSRERSTLLLAERIAARRRTNEPVIVTGDFNVGEANPAIATMLRAAEGKPAPFIDTFRAVHPDEKTVGTFSGFKFGEINGDKIDYVLVQPGTEVLSAAIIRSNKDNRYPSDHFPVVARVRLK